MWRHTGQDGGSRIHVAIFDLIFSVFFPPFILQVSATETIDFAVFMDRAKYYRDWSHKLHKTEKYTLIFLFLEFITKKF